MHYAVQSTGRHKAVRGPGNPPLKTSMCSHASDCSLPMYRTEGHDALVGTQQQERRYAAGHPAAGPGVPGKICQHGVSMHTPVPLPAPHGTRASLGRPVHPCLRLQPYC